MKTYRSLTQEEIQQLKEGSCTCLLYTSTQEIDILVQSELIEIFKGHIFLELPKVIFNGMSLIHILPSVPMTEPCTFRISGAFS